MSYCPSVPGTGRWRRPKRVGRAWPVHSSLIERTSTPDTSGGTHGARQPAWYGRLLGAYRTAGAERPVRNGRCRTAGAERLVQNGWCRTAGARCRAGRPVQDSARRVALAARSWLAHRLFRRRMANSARFLAGNDEIHAESRLARRNRASVTGNGGRRGNKRPKSGRHSVEAWKSAAL
jgi:hypothetical protein